MDSSIAQPCRGGVLLGMYAIRCDLLDGRAGGRRYCSLVPEKPIANHTASSLMRRRVDDVFLQAIVQTESTYMKELRGKASDVLSRG